VYRYGRVRIAMEYAQIKASKKGPPMDPRQVFHENRNEELVLFLQSQNQNRDENLCLNQSCQDESKKAHQD
jgi:hypothetical protein